jgi:uncharacterized membrane protein YhaH (DUF805 family)
MNYYLHVLQNYFEFDGRARRSEYWYFVLFNVIISITLTLFEIFFEFRFLSNIYFIAVLIPSIAVGVRRMHDVGKRGWYLLIPIYNLILACTAGESGDNEYGPNPKEINMAETEG